MMITPFPRAWLALLLLPCVALAAQTSGSPLGEFHGHGDVGSPALPGSSAFDPATQVYTLRGAGYNMWFERDEFQFAWRRMSGDFLLRTRLRFEGPRVDNHRKAGLIARASLDDDAPYVDAAEHGGDGLTSLQFRRTKGGLTEQLVLPVEHADVLQLERRGDTYIVSAARYGEPLVHAELKGLELGPEVLAGLFVCSHLADVLETVTFRDVRIVRPPKPGYQPYRDYIGSHLEILDVLTGHLERIHSSAEPFEAPNWTPDGRTLIYNVSGQGAERGRLRRFDLATRTSELIDTGAATRNNNDHVLSFDGKMLGISHHATEQGGRSTIYTLPATGGEPTQITTKSPSYLHGWSPDGKWLVFTGGRNDKYDIYKIPATGGEEIRLTHTPGLSDGAEFSPDGNFIYYNSTRSGTMQLWRMRADGSENQQLTDDAFNNWFPHVSPDGKWIVFLSYLPSVPPAEHPYYQQVYLRLMPAQGGPAQVIAYVFGGQGTINVPSWSPDSRKVAFVSNTAFE